MGSVRTQGGAPPPPGHAARYVAGTHGNWVAIGPNAIWTSPDARTWTLASANGLPTQPGDQISALKRTGTGFIAVGTHDNSPVIFLSANGISWRRLAAAQLHLGQAGAIRYAAAAGHLILIATQDGTAWLSTDGGVSWTPVTVPAGHGALPQITGVAALGSGFVLIRPAKTQHADVFRSPNGTAWSFAATVPARPGLIDGGPAGAVLTGSAGTGSLTAYVSANGTTWAQTAAFGSTATQSVSGVTLASGGAVVTGTTTVQAASRQPLITLVPPHGNAMPVDIGKIPGAFVPQLAVNAVAAAGSTQVAVGSANGFPAAWSSADGGNTWIRAAGRTAAVLDRPGAQQLTGLAHGTAGWLAVGGVLAGAMPHPVVLVSADGHTWDAADGQAVFTGRGLITRQAAAGPAGYVIVGEQSGGANSTTPTAAAWWSAAPAPNGFQRTAVATPDARMLAVTADAAGFVAVGGHGSQASTWTSPDGRAWHQLNLPRPAGVTRAVLQHVAANGRTVAAMGTALTTAGHQFPFVAVSADNGATWSQSALTVPAGNQATVTALAATGSGFTATGSYGSTPGHQDVLVWTSPAWKQATPTGEGLDSAGVQAITALTASGSTLTGVGFTASQAGEQPTYWQAPIR
jgi:hypothetical protein